VAAVLGDDRAGQFGEIEDLPGAVARTHGGRKFLTAVRAGGGKVVNDGVGLVNLPEGLAFMALLPAGFLFDSSRKPRVRGGFFSPSLDGGLPVGAVQAEPTLQLGDTEGRGASGSLVVPPIHKAPVGRRPALSKSGIQLGRRARPCRSLLQRRSRCGRSPADCCQRGGVHIVIQPAARCRARWRPI
jgi:hypothetical protein